MLCKQPLTVQGFAQPTIPPSISSSPLDSAVKYDLFHYFDQVVVQALATVPRTSTTLRTVIARLALSSNEKSSQGVMQSLLALSSLHRHGLQDQAVRFKASALSALRKSSQSGINRHEVAQHVAAMMLLCAFESQHGDTSSCQWLFYIDGAKNVIKASYPRNTRDQGNEYNALLDWVFYQDTMAQFSLRHWQSQTNPGQGPGFDRLVTLLTRPAENKTLQVSQPSLSHFKLLGLLSEVCSAIQDGLSPEPRGEAYKDRLKLLEWKVSQIEKEDVTECFYANDTPLCLESFQLAVLIYLSRISKTAEAYPEITQSRLDRAFAIFAEMEACVREFPLAILGFEARNDLERMTVLDLIERTQAKSPNRSYLGLRNLIQSLWVQDDLAEEQLEYTRKLTAVFSANEVLPALL